MPSSPKILILDCYDAQGISNLERIGSTRAGLLYQRLLETIIPQAEYDILEISLASSELPKGVDLTSVDGLVWTGSNMTIHQVDDLVRNNISFAQKGYELGIPQFGSCWAAQVAAVAAGGACAASPKGREFGLGRKITLTEEGKKHPLFKNKPHAFDCYTTHADIVTALPDGAVCLAYNAFAPIQALAIDHKQGSFWATQYHPEFDCHEIARLTDLRRDELTDQGLFQSTDDVDIYIDLLEQLHQDPTRTDIQYLLAIDDDVLDQKNLYREARNWVEHKILKTEPA